jgi:hypothetical protein
MKMVVGQPGAVKKQRRRPIDAGVKPGEAEVSSAPDNGLGGGAVTSGGGEREAWRIA